jgi:hypothetical protein
MKTSIDIPTEELKQVIAFTGAKTMRDAVNQAVADFNRRQRLTRLANKLGTFSQLITNLELHQLREES